MLLVQQQKGLAEGDAACILHRARREVRQADQIQLSKGILDSEIVVEIAQDILRRLQRKGAELLFAWSAVHADRNSVRRTLEVFKITHGNGCEVRGHLRGGCELDRVLAFAWSRCVRFDFAVGDHGVTFIRDHGDVERRFVRRLVK